MGDDGLDVGFVGVSAAAISRADLEYLPEQCANLRAYGRGVSSPGDLESAQLSLKHPSFPYLNIL